MLIPTVQLGAAVFSMVIVDALQISAKSLSLILVDFHILRRQKENNWSSVNPNSFREGSQANLIIGGGPQQNIIVSIPGEGRCFLHISVLTKPVLYFHPDEGGLSTV